jgi:hypothetical protein
MVEAFHSVPDECDELRIVSGSQHSHWPETAIPDLCPVIEMRRAERQAKKKPPEKISDGHFLAIRKKA